MSVFRACGAAVLVASSLNLGAATFVVTRFDDPVPGPCLPGDCSLREAVIAGQQFLDEDLIQLSAGTYSLTRAGADEDLSLTGDLNPTNPLVIAGAGRDLTIIRQTGQIDRIIGSLGSLTIRDLTLRDGFARRFGGQGDGGAIETIGELTLERVRLTGNFGVHGAVFVSSARFTATDVQFDNNEGDTHGAVFARDINTLRLTRVRIENNLATSVDGAEAGGGAFLADDAQIDTLDVVNNTSRREVGGLRLSICSTGFVQNVAVLDNVAFRNVGGALLTTCGTTGGYEVANLRVLRNVANQLQALPAAGALPAYGGGLQAQIDCGDGCSSLLIRDSLVADNVVHAGDGGGVYSEAPGATFLRTRILNNRAYRGGGVFARGNDLVSALFYDSILATNQTVSATLPVVGGGGGLYIEGDPSGGGNPFAIALMQAEGLTIAHNQIAADHRGAGSYIAGELLIDNSTYTDNRGPVGAPIPAAIELDGGRLISRHLTVTPAFGAESIDGALIRTQSASQIQWFANLLIGRCAIAPDTTINNLGFQLQGPGPGPSCLQNPPAGTAGIPLVNLALGPLMRNGGPTPTRMPAATSVVRNQIGAGSCELERDQRGVLRLGPPNAATCDVGAVEYAALDLIFENPMEW